VPLAKAAIAQPFMAVWPGSCHSRQIGFCACSLQPAGNRKATAGLQKGGPNLARVGQKTGFVCGTGHLVVDYGTTTVWATPEGGERPLPQRRHQPQRSRKAITAITLQDFFYLLRSVRSGPSPSASSAWSSSVMDGTAGPQRRSAGADRSTVVNGPALRYLRCGLWGNVTNVESKRRSCIA
jgi:hypothetical protein